jgi:type VI secretion system secreted protein Hcp
MMPVTRSISSPLNFKALANNEAVDGILKFFRPHPKGDGTTEQFYTVEFKGGRVSSVRDYSPDCIDPVSTNQPPMEEVGFVFNTIMWTYMDGGITHQDTWSGE